MTLMSLAPVPDWLIPPERGFEAADLDHLPDLPPHTELIDGSLILVSPQADFHTLALDLLVSALRSTAPPELRVRREMTVTLGPRQRPEPDVIVIHAEAVKDRRQTTYQPDDVVLAIEVVSPESRLRDRKRKPSLYAEAGIEHFWLVENKQGKPVLHTFVLERDIESYVPIGIYEDIVQLSAPYPIKIDFGEIDRF